MELFLSCGECVWFVTWTAKKIAKNLAIDAVLSPLLVYPQRRGENHPSWLVGEMEANSIHMIMGELSHLSQLCIPRDVRDIDKQPNTEIFFHF
jgi:hypothetical protein